MDQPLMTGSANAELGSQMGRLVPKPLRRREILTHIVPLGMPYHAIGSMSEVNTDDSRHPFGTVQLNYNMNFSSVEAPIKGGEIAADILERKVEEVIANNRQTLIEPDFANPNQNLYYTVDQDDIESAIHQYAFQNINDKGFTPTPFTIEWRTSNNVPRKEETITYPELAEKMGVTPEDLEVVVFRVEEGHEDKTVEDALGVVPTMKLEGNFYVEKDNTLTREAMDQTDEALHTPTGTRALPIRVLTLRPIATPTIREHDINPNEPELLDE